MRMLMRCFIVSCAAMALASGSASAAQMGDDARYTLDDYKVTTAGDLYDVCTVDKGHAQHFEAQSFCYGFLAGGKAYHDTVAAAKDFRAIVCPPPNATRAEAVTIFVKYIDAHPEARQGPPMDTLIRALATRWPCK
jgi:Rap1a immunity proteins